MGELRLTVAAPTSSPAPRAHVVGQDRQRWLANTEWVDGDLCIRWPGRSGGVLSFPWPIDGRGDYMVQTANLLSRDAPYRLTVELARGRINAVRNVLAEWSQSGWACPPDLADRLKEAQRRLARAITARDGAHADEQAMSAYQMAQSVGEEATIARSAQVIATGPTRLRSPTRLGAAMLGSLPKNSDGARAVLGHATAPVSWRSLEPTQGTYSWTDLDEKIAWLEKNNVPFTLGPIIDWRTASTPEWLSRWSGDFSALISLMTNMVETVIGRYQGRAAGYVTSIRLEAGELGALTRDQRLLATLRLLQAARNLDVTAPMVLGLAHPWGEQVQDEVNHFDPFEFVDTLTRLDVRFSAIELELALGFRPDGSYRRSALEVALLLDKFERLGTPIWVRVAQPIPAGDAAAAREALGLVTALLAHRAVERVTWGRLADESGGDWAEGGLLSAAGAPKPALTGLADLRRKNLTG